MQKITTVPIKALHASEAQTMRYHALAQDMAKLLRDHPCDGSAGLVDKLEFMDVGLELQASWTEEQPTQPGYYWFWCVEDERPELFEITLYQYTPGAPGLLHVCGSHCSDFLDTRTVKGQWYGPIPGPPRMEQTSVSEAHNTQGAEV